MIYKRLKYKEVKGVFTSPSLRKTKNKGKLHLRAVFLSLEAGKELIRISAEEWKIVPFVFLPFEILPHRA